MLFHLLCRQAIYFASINLYLNVCLFGQTGRRCALRPPPIANSLATDASTKPIRVAERVRGKKHQNVFYDDRGFPDQSHEFDVLLRTIDGGTFPSTPLSHCQLYLLRGSHGCSCGSGPGRRSSRHVPKVPPPLLSDFCWWRLGGTAPPQSEHVVPPCRSNCTPPPWQPNWVPPPPPQSECIVLPP